MWVNVTLSWVVSASSAAVTVTACSMFQFWVVNVSALLVSPDRVRSLPDWPLTVTVTLALGAEDSFTV